ncbi:metal/formaldehyde-sensitive transcriptional repressor [Acinetobacter sp. ANC 4910]|uniref:metal/formaldehyde-sensitive transcriptional repressor n=1 Tax=Acinetobacter sp. ANC 4910 TaxID=2529850 RepID=UPI00103D81BA|nr:metal/formaldehyde-sensitive transcriptional repressor [Acinetobacter sp. ANC 4910]TCB31839.1 metal/formaldehyde-sensitive transcriptional repressor [Acinetobacter sp. ANC 4910]
MGHLYEDQKIKNRVKRLQGQIQAIDQALMQPESSCIEVLQQVAAVKGAVNGLMNELIEAHLRHHVLKPQSEFDEAELAEFLKLLKRYG